VTPRSSPSGRRVCCHGSIGVHSIFTAVHRRRGDWQRPGAYAHALVLCWRAVQHPLRCPENAGCARRRGTDRGARLGACPVPRGFRAGRPERLYVDRRDARFPLQLATSCTFVMRPATPNQEQFATWPRSYIRRVGLKDLHFGGYRSVCRLQPTSNRTDHPGLIKSPELPGGAISVFLRRLVRKL